MERLSEFTAPVDRVWVRPAVLFPMFGLVSLMAGTLPSFSFSANFLVLGVGGLMLWLGASGSVPRREPVLRMSAGALLWIVPVGLLVLVEAVTFLLGSSDDYPTLSRLADPVLDRYLPRSALFFAWVSGFWGLIRR